MDRISYGGIAAARFFNNEQYKHSGMIRGWLGCLLGRAAGEPGGWDGR